MPAFVWSELGLGLVISLVMAALSTLSIRAKAVLRDDEDEASERRLFVAYFLGSAAVFAAIRGLEGVWRYAALIAIASPVLAISANGTKPLLSRAYALNVAMAAGVCLAISGVITLFGLGDGEMDWLTAPRIWRW